MSYRPLSSLDRSWFAPMVWSVLALCFANVAVLGRVDARTLPPESAGSPPRATPPLDADLLRDLPPAKARPAAGVPGSREPSRTGKPMDDQTGGPKSPVPSNVRPKSAPADADPRSTEDGEDIDLDSPAARVRRIHERMAAARDRLARRDTSLATQQLQDQVLSDLDAFLDQLQKSSSQSPPSAGSSAAGKQAAPTAPGPRQSRPRPKDSSLEGGATGQGGAGERDPSAVAKEVWGQWPARLREQLQNSMPEKFLPAYESLIEAYYRRLAEEPLR